jgi:replicative DNA helicase
MDAHTAEITIKLYLTEMRDRLERAVNIARAAQACADAGHVEKGIEVALDIEQLVYEVSTFLNAASLINRLGRS